MVAEAACFLAAVAWLMVEGGVEDWLLQGFVQGVGGSSPGEFVMSR